MGEISRERVIEILLSQNQERHRQDCEIYADAYIDYAVAQRNISENGQIVMHPKTGAPIENPYLKVRALAVGTMSKMRVKSSGVWGAKPEKGNQ